LCNHITLQYLGCATYKYNSGIHIFVRVDEFLKRSNDGVALIEVHQQAADSKAFLAVSTSINIPIP